MSSLNKIVFILASALLLTLPPAAWAQLKAGDNFPALAPADFGGAPVPSIQGKVALVDFWASWCAPCRASFPAYARIDQDYAPRGLVIVAVSVDETEPPYAAFVKKMAPPFAAVRDRDHKLVTEVNVPSMPTSYLIDRSGRVRFVHVGYHSGETERTLRKEIETLLSEKG